MDSRLMDGQLIVWTEVFIGAMLALGACVPHTAAPTPVPPPGPRWTLVPTLGGGVVEMDTTKADVGRPHNLIIWVRETYGGEVERENDFGHTFMVHVALMRMKVNCGRHEIGWIEQKMYDQNGNVTYYVERPDVDLATPEPGSRYQAVLRAVCGQPTTE